MLVSFTVLLPTLSARPAAGVNLKHKLYVAHVLKSYLIV